MKHTKLLVVLVFSIFFYSSSYSQLPFTKNSPGRLIISSDGNAHDKDDWAASVASLMMLAKAQMQKKLVLYTYSDHIWLNNSPGLEEMRKSINGARSRWNFNTTNFIEAKTETEKAYNAVRDEVNKSSVTNPLYIIIGGPTEVVAVGMQRAKAEKRKFVTLISHSSWNEEHSDFKQNPSEWDYHRGTTWKEMKNQFAGSNSPKFIDIKDQNSSNQSNVGFNTNGLANKWSYWNWMRTHPDASVKWAYKRMEVTGKPDMSDAGMTWFLIKNDQNGNQTKLKNFIGDKVLGINVTPPTADTCSFVEKNGLLVIEAESANDFASRGYKLETKNIGNSSPLGAGYLRYTGSFNVSVDSAKTLSYKVKINNPGTYQFLWRNTRDPLATKADAGNDSWLLIKGDGARFYGKKDNVEYTLTKHTKVWIQNSNLVYRINGETHVSGATINGMSMWADFNKAGEYTIELGGRSKGHSIDRIVMFKSNREAAAKSLTTPESSKINCNDEDPDEDNQSPFGGIPNSIPGKIQAENFDEGGQGIAYNDVNPANDGGQYRPNEGVDIQATTDADGGYNVGWMASGEWLEYTVNVTETRLYDMYLRVASNNGNGKFKIQVDGNDITEVLSVPNTTGWQVFQTISLQNVNWTKGVHVVRIQVIEGGMNMNSWAVWPARTPSNRILSDQGESPMSITVYPNPIGDEELTIELNGIEEGVVSYVITDINGRTIVTGKSNAPKAIRIPSSVLSVRGMYILKIIAGNKQFFNKIIKTSN